MTMNRGMGLEDRMQTLDRSLWVHYSRCLLSVLPLDSKTMKLRYTETKSEKGDVNVLFISLLVNATQN